MQFLHPQLLVDQTSADYPMTAVGWQEFHVAGIKARHVRLRITGVEGKSKAVVRQMEIISGGRNVALMRPTREKGTAWNSGHVLFHERRVNF